MICLDTNVLIRVHLADDPEQHAAARTAVSAVIARGETIFCPLLVLAEADWTMSRALRLPKTARIERLGYFFEDEAFVIENEEIAVAAFEAWRTGPADFADYVIAFTARAAGATTTQTFDDIAGRCAGFTPVPA